jgi:hypothetical protein
MKIHVNDSLGHEIVFVHIRCRGNKYFPIRCLATVTSASAISPGLPSRCLANGHIPSQYSGLLSGGLVCSVMFAAPIIGQGWTSVCFVNSVGLPLVSSELEVRDERRLEGRVRSLHEPQLYCIITGNRTNRTQQVGNKERNCALSAVLRIYVAFTFTFCSCDSTVTNLIALHTFTSVSLNIDRKCCKSQFFFLWRYSPN